MIIFHRDGDELVVDIKITGEEGEEEILTFSRKCLNGSTAKVLAMMLNDMFNNAIA